MIFIYVEDQWHVAYWLTLIEVIFLSIFLYFAHRMVMTALLDDKSQEAKRSSSSSVLISLGIVFGISILTRYVIGFLGYYWIGVRVLDTPYFSLAIMVTLFFPFYIYFLKTPETENFYLKSRKLRKIYLMRSLFVIIASWITFLVFLSTDVLDFRFGLAYELLQQIPPSGPLGDFFGKNPIYDPFLLGFEWALFALIIDVVLTKIIIRFLPSKKQPPKIVVNKATYLSSVIAFGIWSIQLVIVELYLSRLFGIDLYEQDIRVLFAVVSLVFFASFYLSNRFMFLPKDRKEKKKLMQEFIRKEELEAGKIKEQEVILNVQDLTTRFFTEEGVVYAVEGISFKIYKGEVLGFVGETGCGKSVSALSILQLIQHSHL